MKFYETPGSIEGTKDAKSIEDLPVEVQDNFVPVKNGGFVTKEAAAHHQAAIEKVRHELLAQAGATNAELVNQQARERRVRGQRVVPEPMPPLHLDNDGLHNFVAEKIAKLKHGFRVAFGKRLENTSDAMDMLHDEANKMNETWQPPQAVEEETVATTEEAMPDEPKAASLWLIERAKADPEVAAQTPEALYNDKDLAYEYFVNLSVANPKAVLYLEQSKVPRFKGLVQAALRQAKALKDTEAVQALQQKLET
jgi:hypothetical protein